MPEPHALSLAQVLAQIREGELSPVELIQSLLDQIDRLEPSLQAWVTLDREGALRAAGERERQLAHGERVGPLHGAPVGVKDIFYTEGMRTTAGSPLYTDFVPTYDATAVARLKQAGAIVLGKTVTTQFACGEPGPTRNSWDLNHTPGGSSSGSGAAVGARMCPAALGSQTGGSTLRPASYNGVVGLKPTYGRISRYGVFPMYWSVDTVGIIVRSVEDAAIMLQCLAGHDANDPSSSEREVPDYVSGLDGLASPPRIGLVRERFFERCDQETRRHTEAVAERLAGAGADVETVAMPQSYDLAATAKGAIGRAEFAAAHEDGVRHHPEAYEPKLRRMVEVGTTVPASSYLQAQRIRRRFRIDLEETVSRFDVLMTPSTPTPAPRDLTTTGSSAMQSIWTYAGLPALSLPSGLSKGGMPLGIQLIGGGFDEAHLLAVGRWCEQTLAVELCPPMARRPSGPHLLDDAARTES